MWTAFCRVIKNSKLPWTAQYELPIYMYFDPQDIWYRDESVLIMCEAGDSALKIKLLKKGFLLPNYHLPCDFPLDSRVTCLFVGFASPYIRRHQINMKLVNFVDIWIFHIFLWKPPLCVLSFTNIMLRTRTIIYSSKV